MKKYYSLGELLIDYREVNNLTQTDVAAMLEVDVRTIARWEKNESLIKTDKEEDVVEETFIPYQVIHNLNAAVPLPIYYDFSLRKYSLTAIEQELPPAEWFRSRMDATSSRVKTISSPDEIESIIKFHRFLYRSDKHVSKSLISHAAKTLPELNLIVYDAAGFYAGHHVALPLSRETYEKLREREITDQQLREADIRNYKTASPAVFYIYSVYADCNENFYYLIAALIRFIKKLNAQEYVYGGLVVRHDALQLLREIGIKKIWEDTEEQKKFGMAAPPAFFEGQFNHQLLGH